MKNSEIRNKAISLFDTLITASWNEENCGDSGFEWSANQLISRFINAIRWSKEVGEYEDLKYACNAHRSRCCGSMRLIADECYSLFE